MKKLSIILAVFTISFAFSCKNQNKKDQNNKMQEDIQKAMSKDSTGTKEKEGKITLTKIEDFPAYKEVTLDLEEPSKAQLDPGEVEFNFDVEGMDLGEQTKDADKIGLANGEDGQHIHFIIDDEPYMAFYEDDFKKDLDEGSHILVAFPARSYHMSIKNKDAFVAKKFIVGDASNDSYEDLDLENDPTLIYSRPKGTYEGKDTKKVLLDFYLLNTDLSPNGNKVKATINNQEFMLDDWAPYAMEGLPEGENTVKLELLDKEGNLIEGPFNSVERTFTLQP